MVAKRIIPCLDVKDGRTVKGVNFVDIRDAGDPVELAWQYSKQNADELVFLDITASTEKKGPNFKLLSEISTECFMPLGYGGGISTLQEIEQLFNLGIEKVILNSNAFSKPELLKQAITIFGSQSIVASMDVRKNWLTKKQTVYTLGGQHNTKINPLEYAKQMENIGVGELIVNSIDQDGTMDGYNYGLIKNISESVKIPIVALGGAGSIEDLQKAKAAGASALSAGSLFVYQKPHRAVLITYPSKEEFETLI